MERREEYRRLAENVHRRAGEETNALLKAQWDILATTYVRLADQSPKKLDDTGTYDDWDRRWQSTQ
jgi:hypothetical protein